MITEKMSLKSFGLFSLSIFALVFVMGLASAATLAQWPLTTSLLPSSVNANVTTSDFSGSTGIGTVTATTSNGASAAGWDATTSPDANEYFQVTLTPKSGFQYTLSNVNFVYSSSPFGPNNTLVQWSKSSTFSSPNTIENIIDVNTTLQNSNSTLSVTVNQGETLFIRWFAYNASDDSGTFRVKDLNLQGTVTPVSTTTLTELACTDNGVLTPNNGDLGVDIRDITVIDGFGKDEEWLLLDEVEVEIRVENNGKFDVDDISLEWGIANDDLSDWAVDFDEIEEFNLKDGDEDTFTVTFKVDDDDLDMDLDQLSGLDYNLVVRATGVIDDSDNGPFDNTDTCAADFSEVSVQDESNFVILTNFNIPETVQCGDTVQVTADVWNIGDRPQDEVSVDVYDKDKEFINKIFEVGDIDEFENTELSLSFQVPIDAEEKTYTLTFRVLDEDNDIYENSYDDDPAEFFVPLQVSGNCGAVGAEEVSVSANIVSGGRAGQELVVRATVTNTGTTQKTYALNVAGFEDLASSFSLDKNSLTLGAGQSGDVSVTLNVNDDAAGSRTFFLELVSGGELVRQPVTVSISERRAGITGLVTGENWYLWGIGLLNVLLVVVIIIVAVRIARK